MTEFDLHPPSLPAGRGLRAIAALALVTLLSACARPIVVSPDPRAISDLAGPKIPGTLSLHIPQEDVDLEVTTSGGGGDSVRYFLYRDMEGGLVLALSNVFEKVVVQRKLLSADEQRTQGISLSVRPRLATASGSSSAFTWPPTFFNMSVAAPFVTPDGKVVATVQESGVGNAVFSEFIKNFGLAGQRAAAEMLNRLQSRIFATPEIAGPLTKPMPPKPAAPEPATPAATTGETR